MTTASFTKFTRTVEGQYQVSLGHALGIESSEDGISRMLPIRDPIIILNKKKVADFNPNAKNKTLSLICNYVRCSSMESCTTTIRFKGHCCDVCGGVLSFASTRFNLDTISKAIQEVVKENNLAGLLLYSIDRIDEEDVIPQYQVAVLPTMSYDETVFRIFIMELHYRLDSNKAPSLSNTAETGTELEMPNYVLSRFQDNSMEYFSVSYSWSRLQHTYALGSKIGGIVTFCILLLVAAAVFWRDTLERERLRVLLFSNESSPFRVIWHQGKKDDDDVVQLVNPDEDAASEEEGEYMLPLPSPPTTPDARGLQSMPASPKNTEDLLAIELKLIE